MTLKYVKEEWLVRQPVTEEVDENVLPVARAIIDDEIKWYGTDMGSANEMSDIIMRFIDLSGYTYNEFYYLVDWVYHYCAVAEAYRMGLLENPEQVPRQLVVGLIS